MTPRESIERECGRRGRDAVVTGCIDLLQGRAADPELAAKVAGRHLLGETLATLQTLQRDDPVPRVRAAAVRASVRIIAARA